LLTSEANESPDDEGLRSVSVRGVGSRVRPAMSDHQIPRTLLRGNRVHDARRPLTIARGGTQLCFEWKATREQSHRIKRHTGLAEILSLRHIRRSGTC
jgi:hypothetical protein